MTELSEDANPIRWLTSQEAENQAVFDELELLLVITTGIRMKRLDRLCTRLLCLLEVDEMRIFRLPEVILLRLLLALHAQVEDLL